MSSPPVAPPTSSSSTPPSSYPASTSFTISSSAYQKAVLHASHHPSAVIGLLLGPSSSPPNITTVLPVAHSALSTSTAPTTNLALALAATLDLTLHGIYYAPSHPSEPAPSHIDPVLTLRPENLHPDRRLTTHAFAPAAVAVTDAALAATDAALDARAPPITDLEDHLLDPSRPWLPSAASC